MPVWCQLCDIYFEESLHIDTEEHRKKRDRMRAIIDTMDAGDDRRRCNAVPDRIQQPALTPNYMQPSSSFVRNGNKRLASKGNVGDKTEKPERGDRKGKKKKSLTRSPPSLVSPKTQATNDMGESSRNRIRTAFVNVAMKDKTKKWELVAVKGKASYLKNRSQRMLKDRMSKYRLVDSKGYCFDGGLRDL
ncbi:hypothetical protein NECAME_13201 [Necator americanus]|uniref:Uncharacterized protein n=1 Tax=Necator americanus TaxID=51031 RepID=W2SZF1_NECAM|nr:hypothetical protein NECAME_13201 [Necator americanus]ETN74087.1 hypothetical protein NECAME_13201 [Necator americanus]